MIEYISNLFKVKTLKYKIREENPGSLACQPTHQTKLHKNQFGKKCNM